MTHRRREASRVLLVDPDDRVLLLRAGGWWFTVGGGIEPGETAPQAAVREVREETGIDIAEADLGPVVFEETHLVSWNGGQVWQHDSIRVARVRSAEVSGDGLEPYERASLEDVRWWTVEELRHSEENIYPRELSELLRAAT